MTSAIDFLPTISSCQAVSQINRATARWGPHAGNDLPGLPQIPAPVTDQSCAATSSANALIGIGCPHAPPSCANLHSARRSRRHRMPFPAGSFLGGFRTPATVQAASLHPPASETLNTSRHQFDFDGENSRTL